MLYSCSKWPILMTFKKKSLIHWCNKYLSVYNMLDSELGNKDTMVIMSDKVLLFTENLSLKSILPICFNYL